MKKSILNNDDLLIDNGVVSHSVAQTVVAQTAPGLSPSGSPSDSPPPPPPPPLPDGDISIGGGVLHTASGLFSTSDGLLFVNGFYHDTVNATLPDFVTDGHGHMLFGAGNPTTGYDLQGNTSPNGSVGLLVFDKIIFRGGADIAPTSDVNGVADFNVAHGGQPGNTSYATWNFNFGVAAEWWQNLSDFKIEMKVGVDGHTFLDLDYNAAAHAWDLHGTNTHVISDGGGPVNKVDENSENIKFFKAAIDAAEPTITGHEYDAGHTYTVQIVGSQSGVAVVDSIMNVHVV